MYDLDKSNRNIKSNSSSYYDDKKYEEHGSIFEEDSNNCANYDDKKYEEHGSVFEEDSYNYANYDDKKYEKHGNTFEDDSNDNSNNYNNNDSDKYRPGVRARGKGSNGGFYGTVTLYALFMVISSVFVGGSYYIYKFSSDLEKDRRTRYTLGKPNNSKKKRIEIPFKNANNKTTRKNNVTPPRPKWNNIRDDLDGVSVQEQKTSPRPKWSNFRDDLDDVPAQEQETASSPRPRWNNLKDYTDYYQEDETSNVPKSK